jgi:hypothetical protein
MTRIAMRRSGAFSGPRSYDFIGGLLILLAFLFMVLVAALTSNGTLLFLLLFGFAWLAFSSRGG